MITKEINKKTGRIISNIRRTGGRRRYDKVTYVGIDANGQTVEITASEYRKFITVYSVDDTVDDRPDFRTVIVKLTKKSANVCVATLELTYRKDCGISRPGDTKIWSEELDGRII